mgnify:CR=1 FL=1
MIIYIDEYHKNLYKNKKKLNVNYVKNTIRYLKEKNSKSIKLPDKLIYFIIYLIKNNCKLVVINNIIYNKVILYKISNNISKFLFNSIQIKWYRILNISTINNVNNQLLEYFFNLYNIYLNKYKNKNIYILQAKHILGINIRNERQLKKYFTLNIYHTVYYIDIIFSIVNKKYLSLDYIYSM